MSTDLKKEIKNHISTIESPSGIYELFRILKFPEEYIFDETYKRKKQEFGFRSEDIDRILHIYQVMLIEDRVPVFLIETKTLSKSFIRNVTEKFDRHYRQFLLIFSVPDDGYSNILFVLPAREKVEGKYKLKLIRLNVNKEEIIERNEHYTVINILFKIQYQNENYRELWKKLLESFSVEKVTEEFFKDYQEIFFDLREQIKEQGIPQREAHEFTLQLLNRIMFTYFISKKKWLKYPNFMKWYWNEYKKFGKFGSDEFYEKWLKELFFKAFNNRQDEVEDLPEKVKEVILGFPYLNGGLFTENKNDKLDIKISDETFKKIFGFFEKYNFTIKEDAPFDVEVAVDPQMIGYVYESLSNVAEEIYDRNDMGIFYTPRVEVDFMCRRSLVEYLSKKLPEVPKEQFYHFIFDLPEEKRTSEKYFTKEDLWYDLRDALDDLSVVDPACGSGAFLVGMLIVLDELYKIIYKHTKDEMTDFERKFRIIQYSLYGVDVMPWAIHAAELRLWLQLIIETELKAQELKKAPLLPNLDLNLRIGDSIVQEIGGVNINIRAGRLPSKIKKRLEDLKEQKRLYYENSRSARLKNPEAFKEEEIRIFEEIINHQIKELEKKLEFKTKDSKSKQVTLKGEIKEEDYKLTKKEIKAIKEEIKKLTRIKEALHDPEKKPFVWDIDFAEIFGEKGGFDIVIGNPPYVKNKNISPPNKVKSEVNSSDKAEYKNKLVTSISEMFPNIKLPISKRSDYYFYFYFQGLSILNELGTLCFITSNSWLSTLYGKALQEFLLKFVPIIGIYDNPVRSFSHASINTVICLLGSPIINKKPEFNKKLLNIPQNTVKFVLFKKPFSTVINTSTMIDIEKIEAKKTGNIFKTINNITENDSYRVFPIMQEDLLEDGWKYPPNYDKSKGKFKKGSYDLNNWGRFLWAPMIYWKIIEKGLKQYTLNLNDRKVTVKDVTDDIDINKIKDLLIKITERQSDSCRIVKDICSDKYYLVDENQLKPLFVRLRDLGSIEGYIHGNNVGDNFPKVNFLESISDTNKILLNKNTAGVKLYGVKNKGNSRKIADILFPRMIHKRFLVLVNEDEVYAQKFYKIILNEKHIKEVVGAFMNSTIGILQWEVNKQSVWGEGASSVNSYDITSLYVLTELNLDNKLKENFFNREIREIFKEIGLDENRNIKEQTPTPLPDRFLIDKIIFDKLNLTEEERKEVYWSVAELVKKRLEKANFKKST